MIRFDFDFSGRREEMADEKGGPRRPLPPYAEPEACFRRLQRADPRPQKVHRQGRKRHARHACGSMSGRTCQGTSRRGKTVLKLLCCSCCFMSLLLVMLTPLLSLWVSSLLFYANVIGVAADVVVVVVVVKLY